MNNIIIADREALQAKLDVLKKGGAGKLHIITDFDRTLTRAFIDGQKTSTSYDPIDRGLPSPEFRKKARELLDFYLPIEYSNELSYEEKSKHMVDWWDKYFNLAIEHGISEQIIKKTLEDHEVRLRPQTDEVLKLLDKHHIPLLVFSAGIGNMIELALKKQGLLLPNTHIISNFFLFDKEGRAMGHSHPLIHTFNKDERHIKKEYKELVKDRTNAILLGDSLGDPRMADGMRHDAVLKIGFLNQDADACMEQYKTAYDVILLNDCGMEPVQEILHDIIKR